ncbi:HCT [Linum perenne]
MSTADIKPTVIIQSKLTAVSSKPVGLSSGKTRHELTVLDRAKEAHTVHMVLYYKKNPFVEVGFDFHPLRVSLAEAFSLYPPVTGRLDRVGEEWVVKCNDAGVRVLRGKVGIGLDEWLHRNCDEMDLAAVEVVIPGDQSPSLKAETFLQISEFEGGCIAIGLSCPHMLADPTSLILFFNSWINIHRNQPILNPPFFHSSTPSAAVPAAQSDPNSFNNYYHASESKMTTSTFSFTSSTVEKWLDQVRDNSPRATPFDLLASLFWTRIAEVKATSTTHCQQQRQSLCICLDFRRLLHPPLPLGYFGNAMHFSLLSLNEEDEEMVSNRGDLGRVVELVRSHVSGIDHDKVLSGIKWLESWKKNGGRPFSMYDSTQLTCVSMEHMIMENGDSFLYRAAAFEDDERPVHVACHVGNVKGGGLIMVMPSSECGLARTVLVTLPVDEMAKLCEDFSMMPTVCGESAFKITCQ